MYECNHMIEESSNMKSPVVQKKILIAGFQHETNTFGATNASFDDFMMADSWPGLLQGQHVIQGTLGTTLPIAGFIDKASQHKDICLIPILWCAAEPSAEVTDNAFEKIAGMICDGIKQQDHLDAIYLDLHGAMVTESYDDGEGELLRRIRAIVGDALPISISLDSHANLTQEMIDFASSITLFRSYPHLDMDITGGRAFDALMPLLSGQKRYKAWHQSPYLIALPEQYSGAEPMLGLYEKLSSLDNAPLSWCEFATGFPAADTKHTGPAVLAQAETPEKASQMARVFFEALIDVEAQFNTPLFNPDEAVSRAISTHHATGETVIIADVEDNPGAGAPSDTTGLLHALMGAQTPDCLLGMVNDPDVASAAHDAGLGQVFTAQLGGKAAEGDPAVDSKFEVLALSDGIFDFNGAMYKGLTADAGLSALIRPIGTSIKISISSKRCQCLDQAIFTHFGEDPNKAAIIAVKSTVHYRADFDPISRHVINTAANGLTPCRLADADFKHLRKGLRLGANGPNF